MTAVPTTLNGRSPWDHVLAGEPVDILVNGKLVGRGEVVVIEAMFGVRVTDIIPPDQRWKYR